MRSPYFYILNLPVRVTQLRADFQNVTPPQCSVVLTRHQIHLLHLPWEYLVRFPNPIAFAYQSKAGTLSRNTSQMLGTRNMYLSPLKRKASNKYEIVKYKLVCYAINMFPLEINCAMSEVFGFVTSLKTTNPVQSC